MTETMKKFRNYNGKGHFTLTFDTGLSEGKYSTFSQRFEIFYRLHLKCHFDSTSCLLFHLGTKQNITVFLIFTPTKRRNFLRHEIVEYKVYENCYIIFVVYNIFSEIQFFVENNNNNTSNEK